ncbi:MAG: CCA tRNA nucleotidyltransferase [Gorillibacterium sp.]|nr:CCA tRNA nucleotidyltransferase [Gorillibacterium sp.]
MRREAASVLTRLEEAGYIAFFVGGFIRDTVLHRPVKDIDLATSARPEDVIAIFPKVIPTGLKHGTVTVLSGGFGFEVTTFRTESEYENFRRPREVVFVTDITEDLRRRDFTMNAMAMDRQGRILDPFNGRRDLESGILRCVGDADLRFREDALRMVRCIRFAAEYRLKVESNTWLALHANAKLLRHVAMERVRSELERILKGSDPYMGISLLADSRLLKNTKEKLSWALTEWTTVDLPPVLKQLGSLSSGLRWFLLAKTMKLTTITAEQVWRLLTFSQAELKQVSAFLGFDHYLEAGEHHPLGMANVFKNGVLHYGREAAQAWLETMTVFYSPMSMTDNLAVSDEGELQTEIWGSLVLHNGLNWLSEMPVFEINDLMINGQDILTATHKNSGPWLGRVLRQILSEAACNRLPNEKELLLRRAVELAVEEC